MRSPLVCFSVCALAFIGSILFLSGSLTFWVSDKVRLWHLLFALAPSLWVASVLVMFHEWRNTRVLGSGSRGQRLAAGATVVLAAVMEEGGAERPAEDLRRYQQLRSRLERFLGFAAANIGLAILSFSAFGSMLIRFEGPGRLSTKTMASKAARYFC